MRSNKYILALVVLVTVVCARSWMVSTGQASPTAVVTEELPVPPLKKDSIGQHSPISVIETTRPDGMFTEFRRLTQDTLAILPLTEDVLANKTHDFHFSPPELLKTSPALGKIADALKEHSELVPQGIEFYDTCARNGEVLVAVRVVCLHRLKHWVGKQPDVTQLRHDDYPEELWRLSESMPPVR
jgi:hypothetical protein